MSRKSNAKSLQILHIGRVDEVHQMLWEQLQREGIEIAFARTQKQGLLMATESQPQVVVISTADTHCSGVRLCRALGRRLSNARRLLIVERGTTTNAPCEQRLVRPFTDRKLRDALFKLLAEAAPHVLRAGSLQLDLISRVLTGPNGQRHLTPRESDLLAAFMKRPNQVISRKDLMDLIWDTAYLGDTRTLDVHVRWLRQKLEADPAHPVTLVTRRGVGYALIVPELAAVEEMEDDLSDGSEELSD
jgi:DNA-binding response OmpR family regulator